MWLKLFQKIGLSTGVNTYETIKGLATKPSSHATTQGGKP